MLKPQNTHIRNFRNLKFYLAKDTKQKDERNKLGRKGSATYDKGLLFKYVEINEQTG